MLHPDKWRRVALDTAEAELPSASPALGEHDLASLMLAPHVLAPPCGMSPACASLRSPTPHRCLKALQAFLTSELAPGSFFTPRRKFVYSDSSSGLGHLNCRKAATLFWSQCLERTTYCGNPKVFREDCMLWEPQTRVRNQSRSHYRMVVPLTVQMLGWESA